MDKLKVNINNLTLENPVIIASGILGTTASSMRVLYEKGAGAIVTKSTSLKPKKGNLNPTIVSAPCGLINAMGLPNPGIEEMTKEVRLLASDNIPVIGSVAGESVEEYVAVSLRFEEAGVVGVELNVSCPHERAGLIGQDCDLTYEIVKEVKKEVNIPVIVKLTPNVTDITAIAVYAEKAGADALTAINTVKAMAIDIKTGIPVLSKRIGGLSGPSIKPIAIRSIYEIYEKIKIPIIGVGGITSWEDAVEFILAGSKAFQIGSGLIKGYDIIEEIKRGLIDYLESKNLSSIEQLTGLAHKNGFLNLNRDKN